MGVEQHSYGSVLCGLMTRRRFVQLFSAVCLVITSIQLLAAFTSFLMANIGAEKKITCTGSDCYDVFSCSGMQATTQHIREPFLQGLGAAVFFLGLLGASYGSQWQLQYAGQGITILGVAYLAMLIYDLIYTKSCGAYSLNIVDFVLTPPSRIPPSPLGGGIKETLNGMSTYPVSAVASLTNNFNVLAWYSFVAGFLSLALLYAGTEARFLSNLVERGPLGLGVNYGLGQWDEIINHDAIRIIKEQAKKSQFIEDAQLPLPFAVPTEVGNGYHAGPRGTPDDATSYGGLVQGQHSDFAHARDEKVPYLGMDKFAVQEESVDPNGYASGYHSYAKKGN